MLKSEDISVEKIKSGIGGYKKKATKEFVESIRAEYEAICKENLELKDKLGILSEGVQYYKNMEKSLQKALVLAERTTSETMHAAEVKAVAIEKEAQSRAETLKKEAKIQAEACEREAALKANTIICEAKTQADQAIAEGNEELRKIHSQIMTLVQQYEQYKTQYKQLALAQMNVLESEAYNLDAPILKTVQSVVESMEKDTSSFDKTKNMMEHEVVKPVEPIEEPKVMEDFPQKEKKVYVDARGEVVEVHEFREITSPNGKGGIDPFQDSIEDNFNDEDFFKGASDKEVVVSFDDLGADSNKSPVENANVRNDNISFHTQEVNPFDGINKENNQISNGYGNIAPEHSKLVNELDWENVGFGQKNLTSYESMKMPNDDIMGMGQNRDIESRNNENGNNSILTENANFSSVNTQMPENSINASEKLKMPEVAMNSFAKVEVPETTMDSFVKVEVPEASTNVLGQMEELSFETTKKDVAVSKEPHKVSAADMKKIEQMQLERLRQEEEQQAELLKKSRFGKFTNPVSTTSVPKEPVKKEKVSDDFFKVLHNEDEKNQEISLQDLHAKQDEDNQRVPLPKATEGQNMYFSNQLDRTEAVEPTESVNIPKNVQNEQINIHKYTEEEMKTVRNMDVNMGSSNNKNTESLNDSISEQKSFYEQFSANTFSKDFENFKIDEDINSLEQEMDKPENLFLDKSEQQDFLSFRDFKSGM